MSFASEIDYLLDYTDWDRAQWETWFKAQGPEAFTVGLGAHCEGRITNVGELVRHIFSAEQRYVDRVQQVPISDTSTVPANDADALFAFGRQSRRNLRQLLRDFPAASWNQLREVQIGQYQRAVMPRTMVVQSLTHEIRHWAQIATYLRMAGRNSGVHDFLLSGVYERKLEPPPPADVSTPHT